MRIANIVDDRFESIIEKLMNQKLPLKVAYKLRGINKIIRAQREEYEALRREALNRFGNKDEAGALQVDEAGNVGFSQENLQAFLSELNDLVKIEFDVPKISLEELGNDIELSAAELAVIEDLIA